jgi:hypothetical protein
MSSNIAVAADGDNNSDSSTSTMGSSSSPSNVFDIVGSVDQNMDLSIKDKIMPMKADVEKCKSTMANKKCSTRGRVSPVSNAIKEKSCSAKKSSIHPESNHLNELDSFLNENIHNASQVKQPWNKLTRQERVSLLGEFSRRYLEENSLSIEEEPTLHSYLNTAMEKKRLSKVKEIVYDKEKQIITSIPILSYNTVNKRFTLKRVDKRQSTLKSLTPKKNRVLTKVSKNDTSSNSD